MANLETLVSGAITKCFWCQGLITEINGKPLAISNTDGIISIKNRNGEVAPMVYCTSDCLVFDCNLRFEQRKREGKFGPQYDRHYGSGIPERWKHNMPEITEATSGVH